MVVFPAHAGMILVDPQVIDQLIRVPRACGDDPATKAELFRLSQCSPRMRG